MSDGNPTASYGVYWRIWVCLLILTLLMIFVDQLSMPRTALVLVLVGVMLVKATLIAAYFMHLRFESVALAVIVGVGILATGATLFFLIIPDGIRSLQMSSG